MSMALQNEVLCVNMDHPIGRWRKRHHISQDELGRRCQLSQKTISAYESGTRVPRGESLMRLMRETSLPLEALIFPGRFLLEHPDFLMEPPRQGRRPHPPQGGGQV
jgi:transcriptional regulator with XRE-family HTH domain